MSDLCIALIFIGAIIIAIEIVYPMHAIGFHIVRERLKKRKKDSPDE